MRFFTRRLRVVVALVVSSLAGTVDAGFNDWTKSGPNGIVTALARDPSTPSTVYAGILNDFVVKSTDGGESWTALSAGPISVIDLAIDPKTPTVVYAAVNFVGVFKTSDGGDTWMLLPSSPTIVFHVTIEPGSPSKLYAYGGPPVTSTDGGTTWNFIKLPCSGSGFHTACPAIVTVSVDPTIPSTVYLGTAYDGATGEAADGVFKSINGGQEWHGSGLAEVTVTSVAVDPTNSSIVYAGMGNGTGVYKSTDGGEHWNPANHGLIHTVIYFFSALVIDPSSPSTLYAASFTNDPEIGGVFKSTNAGETWVPFNTGLTNFHINALLIDRVGITLLAATDEGLFDFEIGPAGVRPGVRQSLVDPVTTAPPVPVDGREPPP